jgi:transposase
MSVVGVDAHKTIHVAHAIDAAGQPLADWRGPNTPDGWLAFVEWLQQLPGPCEVGIEGAGSYGHGLAQVVAAAGFTTFDINPRWTAGMRRSARRQHKTDPLDARAVALIVRQEAPDLPRVLGDDTSALVHLLVSERNTVVGELTRLRNQLHATLLQLDPAYKQSLPALTSKAAVAALRAFTPCSQAAFVRQHLASIRRMADRMALLIEHESQLAEELAAVVAGHYAPLLEVHGVGTLTAATIAGALGPAGRFASDAQLAAYAGVAPIEASSAGHVHHRLNRGGNRQLNAAFYRIAITQYRSYAPAKAYIAARRAQGKTFRDAIRSLKRYLVRAVFHAWLACSPSPHPSPWRGTPPVHPAACT